METLFLLKYGELTLKGDNQKRFVRKLESNIRHQCKGIHIRVIVRPGRFFIRCTPESEPRVRAVLEKTFGITWFARAYKIPKEIEAIEAKTIELAQEALDTSGSGRSFKIEARRSDKSFPLTSYEIACRLGEVVLTRYPDTCVKLKNPDWAIRVEVRDAAYLYGLQKRAPGGLPAGSAGRGLLLLSGGIDSPVAGYLVAKRGLALDAVYFHTPPFTPPESEEKVNDLARVLASYIPAVSLAVVPFTDVQMKIRDLAQPEEVTLFTRASMMTISNMLAHSRGCLCLVTGESLGQVASQTLASIRYTGSYADLPVFRPLIGSDKEDIVEIARKIGTFGISIRPYSDCCTIFAAEHPLIDPDFNLMRERFLSLGLDGLLEKAAAETQWTSCIGD